MGRNIHNKEPVVAFDFDGTIAVSYEAVNAWYSGKEKLPHPVGDVCIAIKVLKRMGYHIILWTCRTNKDLEIAKEYLLQIGILHCFDKINENIDGMPFPTSNKIAADFYVDDCHYNEEPGKINGAHVLYTIYDKSPEIKTKYSLDDLTNFYQDFARGGFCV